MPRIYSIPGGIHPPQNKAQSLGNPIQSIGLPNQLVIPLAQHIGAPAEAVVAVGDKVHKGQVIAKAPGFVSAPCHAPTSGHISAIGDHPVPHPSGLRGTCITLLPDGEDQWIDYRGAHHYQQLDKPRLLELLREAGIVGMGGAGFPTPVKLATDKAIETLIINGTECEPYITADDKLMQERPEDILEGVKILAHLLSPEKTVIGIEDNKPDALKRMRKAAEGSDIEVVSFPTKYPSGGEKQLIQILTGKEVPKGGLPADIGIVLQNIGTAYAVFRAIRYDEPLLSRIVTVTGDNVAKPGNYEVLIGTPVSHLLQVCGFDAGHSERLIMGGPMMGFALTSTDVPVVKTTNCILAPSSKELPSPAIAQACIRCGMCAQACPASLLPQQLYWFAQGKEYEKLESHHLFDCIECGCCSYVCPSNIPLVQYYRASKAEITTRRAETQKSEQAKIRFEARQQRLEEEQAQKEARRKARSKKTPRKATAAKAPPASAAVASNPAAGPEHKAGPKETAAEPAENAEQTAGSDKKEEVLAALTRVRNRGNEQDPAQQAIAKAQAARANPRTANEQEKLAKLEQRLAKAQAKCDQIRRDGGDNLGAFEASVTNLQQKVDAARLATGSAGQAPDKRIADAEPTTPDSTHNTIVAPANDDIDANTIDDSAASTSTTIRTAAASTSAAKDQPQEPSPTATAKSAPAGTAPTATSAQQSAVQEPAGLEYETAKTAQRSQLEQKTSPSLSKSEAATSKNSASRASSPPLAEQVMERLQHKLQEVRSQYDEARSAGGDQQARELETEARVLEKQMVELMQRVLPRSRTEQGAANSTIQPKLSNKREQSAPSEGENTVAAGKQTLPLATLEKRLTAAREILAQATADQSPKRDAFAQTVANLEQQLKQARQAD